MGSASIFAASGAAAQNTSTTLDVHASVVPACAVSTTPVDFGKVDPTSPKDMLGKGSLLVTCTDGIDWTAGADQGDGYGADIKTRRMTGENGTSTLAYHLFVDSDLSNIWGDGKEGGAFSDTGTGEEQDYIIYGTIPAGQKEIPFGEYRDSVRVTISY